MLLASLMESIKTAQKSGDSARLEVLRFVYAQVKNREIEKRGAGSTEALSDEEVLQVIQKEAKKRREAIVLYEQGGRADLSAKESAELKIIEEYLPAQMSREDLLKVVTELKAGGLTDFNALMKGTMAKVKGQADGKMVSEVVKQVLA